MGITYLLVAFGDCIPLPEWYKTYSMQGVDKVDSDFEMDTSDAEEIEAVKL